MNEEEKQALVERCKTIAAWREKYGDDANVMLPAMEAEQIATIALASLTAEPVAWRHNNGPFGKIATCSENVAKRWEREGFDISPLYTTPPAPEMP